MKLSFLLFTLVLFNLHANSYAQNKKLSLDITNESIKSVLEKIESQSKFNFFYKTEEVDVKRIVSLKVIDTSIEEILDILFKNQNLSYKLVKKQIVLKKNVAIPKPPNRSKIGSLEQSVDQNSISGRVTDSSGSPLPGVNVLEKGTSNGVAADFDGNYNIQLISDSNVLVFSYLGFKKLEVNIENRTVVNASLKIDSEDLEKVVVIGYGTQKKVNLSGSVASVNLKKIIESRPLTNIGQALSGATPGVSVTSSNNRPINDGGASILIRGQGTLNNSEPLVIIDGVESSLNNINPQDVESLSILKDAASSAIYGSRAANGVILITSKKGKAGKMIVDYNSQVSIQQIHSKINIVSDYANYMELVNEGRENSGLAVRFSQEKIDEWRIAGDSDPLRYPNTNWQDELFKTGFLQQHNLSASGGTEQVRFFMSYNYLDNPGIIDNTGFNKHSFRTNIDITPKKWLTLGTQINGYLADAQKGSQRLSNEVFQFAGQNSPGMVMRSPDGRYGTINNPEDNPDSNNILRSLYLLSGEDKTQNIRTRFYGFIKPLKGLTLQGSFSYEFNDHKQSEKPNFIGEWDFYNDVQVNDGITQTYIENSNSNRYREFMDAYAEYKSSLGKLDYTLLVGGSKEQFKSDQFKVRRNELLDPSLGVIDAASGESSSSGEQTQWAIQSYFSRLNLAWNSKYLVELNIRADGSSRFLDDNRWGYFPSGSIGWRISEERFLSDISWISLLKFRASYGVLGNNSVGDFEAQSVYSASNYVLNNAIAAGVRVKDIANANLTWESTNVLDIGFDYSLFNSRITGVIDYFNKQTDNILIDLPAPLVRGNASIPKQNAAEVVNKGVEFSLNYRGAIGSKFNYTIGGNVAFVENEVTKFKGEEASFSGDKRILEGRPVNELYVLEFDRIVQTQADLDLVQQIVDNAPLDEDGKQRDPFSAFTRPELGDILYQDANNDGIIDNDDRIETGDNSLPDWTFGVNIGATWKGFDLGVFLQGSLGARATYRNDTYSTGVKAGYQINQDIVDGRYYTGRDVANNPAIFPRLAEIGQVPNNHQNSTFWVADMSYIRIKNMQLGYTLQDEKANKVGLTKIRLYTSLENFFTFTDWPGLDPEVTGVDYPVIKQAILGLNISF